jgi:hypothetical protein
MPTHPLHAVRFESVACLNPLLDESLLVVDPQAWFAARAWLTANPRSLARAESLDARALDALLNTRVRAHGRTLRRGNRPAERVAAGATARPEPRDLRR